MRCCKTCATDGPGQISCTNHIYSRAISARVLPSNKKDVAQCVKFVQTHRPDFQAIDYRVLCMCASRKVVSTASDEGV